MHHITISEFSNLNFSEQTKYYNQLINSVPQYTWEVNLLESIEAKDISKLSNYSQLCPFFKRVNIISSVDEKYIDSYNYLKEKGLDNLTAYKFKNIEFFKLQNMSDENLLSIKGVGQKTIKKLRKYLKG